VRTSLEPGVGKALLVFDLVLPDASFERGLPEQVARSPERFSCPGLALQRRSPIA